MSADTKAWCGIDFGTSNSAVGIFTAAGNRLATVENPHVTIPTTIFFNFEEKRMQFGRDATAEYVGRTQGRYMRGLKSLLGSSLIEEQAALGSAALSYKGVIGKFLGYLKGRMEQEVVSTMPRSNRSSPFSRGSCPRKCDDRGQNQGGRHCPA